jgi:aminoglycoside/choline kinase family phosphotransferase
MSDFYSRLETFLIQRGQPLSIAQLTPDASIREYFRIGWNGANAIACVYPEAFLAKEQTYLDVTNLFLADGLPVAKIFDFDEKLGVIVQEDFGNTILRDRLHKSEPEERERLIDEAIILIARIQAATTKAYELDSIASRLKFDEQKLLWELNFFKEHYFTSFRKTPLAEIDNESLNAEFIEISRELESHAKVLTHRDFHAANLMLDKRENLRIIDHQDARIGTVSYDLVSFLLDRVSQPPSRTWVREKRLFFLAEREKLGLETLDPDTFANEFHLQAIQRCLKATGTFSFQSTFREKTYFIPYIKPMLQIVLRNCERLERFPNLQRVLKDQIDEK